MCAEEVVKSGLKKKTKTRILKWLLVLAVVVIVLVFFAVPGLVSSKKGRKIILARINRSVDGEVDFGGLTMGWWRGIEIADIKFDDSEGGTSVRVKQVTTKPHYLSILMGSLSFGETEILEPRVEVNLGSLRAEPRQRPRGGETATTKSQPVSVPIERIKVTIKDGNLKVTDGKAETVELSQINSRLDLRLPGGRTNFDVNLAVVDGGKESRISMGGWVVFGKDGRGEGTSGDLAIKVNDLAVGSLGPIFELCGVEVQAKGNISGNIESEIRKGKLEKMKAEVEGRELDVSPVELTGGRFRTSRLGVDVKLARARQMINIENFDIESDWLKADGRGTIPMTIGSLEEFSKTDSSLSGRFELDMAQLFTQMPGAFGLKKGIAVTSGVLRGDVETLMEGGIRKIKGQANLGRLEGMVGGRMVALSEPVRAEAEIISDKGGVSFDKLGFSSAFARISCSGTSELFRYRGDVDLAKFQAELGQFLDTKGYGMAGELSSEGEVSVKEGKVKAVGSSAVKNLIVSYPGKAPFEQREVLVSFDAEAGSVEKAVIVKKFKLESDRIKIHKGQFSWSDEGNKSRLRGQVECDYDWAAVSAIAGPILPAGLVLEGQRKDAISFASEYPLGQTDRLLENLSAKAKAGFAKASYFGLNFGQTEVDVQVENGLLKIVPFSTTVNNGQLSFAAEADFKQKPTLLKTPGPIYVLKDIQINDEAAGALLMYLNPIFANAVRVSGSANFEAEKLAIPLSSGTKGDIEVIGTISISQLRLEASDLLGQILSAARVSGRGVDITVHPTRFTLQKGFLKYDDMQMDVGEHPFNFRGVIGLDRSLNMTVTLPYTTRGDKVRIGKEFEGKRVSLPLKGTIVKPELDLGRLLEEQLKGRLMEELGEVLKK